MACLTPWDKQTARVFDTDGCFHSLFANSDKSGLARDAVLTIRKNRKAYRRVAGGCRGNGEECVSRLQTNVAATGSYNRGQPQGANKA